MKEVNMKIIFICSSLETGKDGVGDYTRRLAGELIRQGHDASIIALHDKHIESIEKGTQIDQDTVIPVLRLPACITWKKRVKGAKKYIEHVDPEWLSLQYVPFGFHNKGLPFFLGKRLAKIGKERMWHIMFHELWVGMNHNPLLKLKIWGYMQKKIVISLCKSLCPKVTHTHSALYRRELSTITSTVILPLFSNISCKQHISINRNKEFFNALIFGGIHYGAPIEKFVIDFKKYTSSINRRGKLIFIGNNGNELRKWIEVCKFKEVETEVYGQLSSNKISQILCQADLGVSTTPFWLNEKSGVVAAYKEHQLKTLCVAREWVPSNPENLPKPLYVIEYEVGKLEDIIDKDIEPYRYNLSVAARQFLNNLTF